VNHGKEFDPSLPEPDIDIFERAGNVVFRPAPGPDVGFTEFSITYPVAQSQICIVFYTSAFLLGRANDEDASERGPRQTTEAILSRSIYQYNAFAMIEKLECRRYPGQPSSYDDYIGLIFFLCHMVYQMSDDARISSHKLAYIKIINNGRKITRKTK
jgi:hypothetical protein